MQLLHLVQLEDGGPRAAVLARHVVKIQEFDHNSTRAWLVTGDDVLIKGDFDRVAGSIRQALND